jgi:hypothetical protein
MQNCFSHNHPAATGPTQTGPRATPPPRSSASVQYRVDQCAERDTSDTARAKNSNPIGTSCAHPLQYTDLGEKEMYSRSQPPGSHRGGETRFEALGLQARSSHARRFNNKSLLARSAPHSEVALGFEADAQGPNKTYTRARRRLSVVGAFKHSQAMPRWLCQ